MGKLKYLIIFIFLLANTNSVSALDIQYGSILDKEGENLLIQYYGIGEKNNFYCNLPTLKCTKTTKEKLSQKKPVINTLDKNIQKEIQNNNGKHITISKNKKWLAYYIPSQYNENTRTYVVKNLKKNVDSILSEKISYWDLVNEQERVFEFSPDEKTLIYLDNKEGPTSLYKVDLDSLDSTELKNTKIQTTAFNISDFIFTDSNNIYYIGNLRISPYNWILWNYNIKTGTEKVIETNVSYTDNIEKINNYLIFNRLQAQGYGPEIYNTKTQKINFLKIPKISTQRDLSNETYVRIDNLNGVLMLPKDYTPTKKYPVMIWLHGGPLRQASLIYHPYRSYGIYDATLKLLPQNEVIVLKLDYSGSFGDTREYSERLMGKVGSTDVEDVLKAVSYMKNNYSVEDFYMSGNSYGGYLALKAIVDYPDIFKGVMSINGVTDWESLLENIKTSIFNTQFYGLPNSKNKNLYKQASIIKNIKNLEDQKIELIQGEADRTIPYWQATDLKEKLESKNKNVNLTIYKGEDHVFKQRNNIEDICIKTFELLGLSPDKECTE